MQVAKKTVVALRYIMKNGKGEVLENILDSSPVKYLHGSGNILPQLESSLEGLEPGNLKSFTFSENANLQSPGEVFHFDVVIDEVRPGTEEEIESGKPITSKECGPDCCC
jgi:FKBP-type peptidyl-prolyl cis-trans isomerase SlyD